MVIDSPTPQGTPVGPGSPVEPLPSTSQGIPAGQESPVKPSGSKLFPFTTDTDLSGEFPQGRFSGSPESPRSGSSTPKAPPRELSEIKNTNLR